MGLQVLVVHQPCRLFFGGKLQRLADFQLARLPAAAGQILEHALDLRRQLLHPGRGKDFHLRLRRGHFDLDLLVVQLAFAQLLPEFLPRRRCFRVFRGDGSARVLPVERARPAGLGKQHIEDAFLGRILGAAFHLAHGLLARLLDADLDQIAHDGIDVAADVADFGELGRLDLDERRVGEFGQAPRDLGLAHAGRPDHENVLRRDLLAQGFGHLLPAPAVPEGDGDRALGAILADDVLVQFVDDFLRGHL